MKKFAENQPVKTTLNAKTSKDVNGESISAYDSRKTTT